MKKNLKPCAYKHIEHVNVSYGTFCRTVRRAYVRSKVKHFWCEAKGKPSLNRATKLAEYDPKPGDLSMSRLKWR